MKWLYFHQYKFFRWFGFEYSKAAAEMFTCIVLWMNINSIWAFTMMILNLNDVSLFTDKPLRIGSFLAVMVYCHLELYVLDKKASADKPDLWYWKRIGSLMAIGYSLGSIILFVEVILPWVSSIAFKG